MTTTTTDRNVLQARSAKLDIGRQKADAAERTAVNPPARRGALGYLTKGGMALVAGLAGVLATSEPAAADCQGSPCCQLARCTVCPGSCRYTCPSGYYRRYWWCAAGARIIGCGECTTSSSSCWSGSFYCSVWWDDGVCP